MSHPPMSEIERRLRADAAATPSRAPGDLADRVIATVLATPRDRPVPRPSPVRWWPLIPAAAAVLAITALVARGEPPSTRPPAVAVAPPSPAPLVLPVSAIANPLAALLPAPGEPLRDEWRAVNVDAAAACRALLACVPSQPRPAN